MLPINSTATNSAIARTNSVLRWAGAIAAWGVLSAYTAADESLPAPAARPVDYAKDIQPLFARACYRCHGPQQQRSGFRLDRRLSAFKGGDLGPAIVPHKSAESDLIRYVAGLEAGLEMPPEPPRLAHEEIGLLRRWIDDGAAWPHEPGDEEAEQREAWWSLMPLVRPAVPNVPAAGTDWVRSPIDAFVLDKLRSVGLSPSPEADRRTLIRRLSFDLHGLPPSPEDVEAFVQDADPQAYERLVDGLLDSPRYGERWARHWLDVVHYGESNGFGMDRPRWNAWPYRDYVIVAFNEDKPYTRFVQEQLAADVLFPDQPQLTPALGFAAAGPFNQSALVEQVDGTECKRIALNLDRDDMVTSVANAFLSMTVHCARCHEHKFDPIPQADYYRLQAVFAGVGRADRAYDPDPQVRARRQELRRTIGDLEQQPDSHPPAPQELEELTKAQAAWEESLAAQAVRWTPLEVESVRSAGGTSFTQLDDSSWLATGEAADKDTYTIHARVQLERLTALRLELLPDDRLPKRGPGRQDNGNLHLSEVRLGVRGTDAASPPAWLALQNASADFNQAGWGVERAVDGKPETAWGIFPEVSKPHHAVFEIREPPPAKQGVALAVELDQLHGQRHLIGRFRVFVTDKPPPVRAPEMPLELLAALAKPPAERTEAERRQLFAFHRLRYLRQQLAQLPAEQQVWAIAADFPPRRNYKPAKEPYPIQVLRRGDLNQPLSPVGPGALTAVRPLRGEFELPDASSEGARRAALARWITDPENMLTWRSIVNRVWHYHFGRGVVDSPNDFGRMTSLPTHPELLDWLAVDFRDHGGSLKRLHRQIVTSAVYRQVSTSREDAARVDGDNRFLWRMNRPRLDAESLRDSLLAISGKLDLTRGGPSVMQFKFEDPNMEVTPRIDYSAFDPDSPASYRRSVYRFLFRNVNDPLLEAFDAADPSLWTPKRGATITPLQALSLWNNRFVLRQSEHLAARLEREAADLPARFERAYRLVLARGPSAEESSLLAEHAARHGLANACRVLLNSNEFLFVP